MVAAFGLVLALIGQLMPQLSEPSPIRPERAQISAEGVNFQTLQFECLVMPLDFLGLRGALIEAGADAVTIDRPGMKSFLGDLLSFRIRLTNRGDETINFNPDHIWLNASRGPVGFQLEMAQFWPTEDPRGGPELERFALALQRATIELGPGQSHTQLVVFRPTAKKFPAKVTLQINRLYVGVVESTVECKFRVRYPK